jgi:hypothetical protein
VKCAGGAGGPVSSLQPPASRTRSLSCMAPQQGTTRRLVAQHRGQPRSCANTCSMGTCPCPAATARIYGGGVLLQPSPPQTCHVNAICDLAIVSHCTQSSRSPSPSLPPASAAAHSHGHARAVQHQEPDHQAHMSVISTHRQPLGARLTVHSKGSLGALRLSLGRLPCRAPRNQPV